MARPVLKVRFSDATPDLRGPTESPAVTASVGQARLALKVQLSDAAFDLKGRKAHPQSLQQPATHLALKVRSRDATFDLMVGKSPAATDMSVIAYRH